MDAAVNLGGRLLIDPANYEVTPASIRRNLRGPWVVDDDPFEINQFLHPYQGAMYHGIARSNGLSYWPSVAYTFAGSALWEIAGETTPPSRNDQIASGIAGSFLGEPLFRISRLLLERADDGPGVWRTLASVLASPPAGINHVLVGNPAGSLAPDAVPFSDIRVQFGASATATGRSRSVSSLALHQPRLALSMDYGYPGNASYHHERPFDYFRIESSVSSEGMEQLSTRGLIAGADYGAGRLGGIWGLYGTLRLLCSGRLSLLQHGGLVRHYAPSIDIRIAGGSEFCACRSGLRRCINPLRRTNSTRRTGATTITVSLRRRSQTCDSSPDAARRWI